MTASIPSNKYLFAWWRVGVLCGMALAFSVTAAHAATVLINANPASVTSGAASTLTWSSSDATNCAASGTWSGSKATSGSQSTGALSVTSTYTLTCTGAGGSASQSVAVTVTPPLTDTTAPSIPTNLTASATSSSQINLAWTASTDAVGVAGYRIYQNGTQITATTSTSYSNTGLSASTTYSYTVQAYDAAGNASAQSTSASATTPASSRYEVNFETGDTSQTGYDYGLGTIIPSDLAGGGNYAYRITLPAGSSQNNCGFTVSANQLPQQTEVYTRWYAKFEPDWRFSTSQNNFKFMFIEPTGSTPGNGRTFLNANTINSTSANFEVSIYSYNSGAWIDTGVDATNDGLWHAYEVRSKRDLTNNSLGAFQVWIDGVLRINLDPVNAGNAPISFINFCYRNGSVPTDTHIVFDEVVISNQYIGLLGALSAATAP